MTLSLAHHNQILTVVVCCTHSFPTCAEFPKKKTTNETSIIVHGITITNQPNNTIANEGEMVSFPISISSPNICPNDEFLYTFKIGEDAHHVDVTFAATIKAQGIKIFEHPQDVQKLVGEIANFSISVEWPLDCTDQNKLLYKWKKNGIVIHTTITEERSASFEKQLNMEDNNSVMIVDTCCKKLNEDDCDSVPSVESSNPAKIVIYDPSSSDSHENIITISTVFIVLLSYLLSL